VLPHLKLALKGRRFCDTSGFNKNATEELKRLSEKFSRTVPDDFTVTGGSV